MTKSELLEKGTRLGAYEIETMIGKGGMAQVYRAFDHDLQRHVALKILTRVAAEQQGFIERFRQEARVIARLRHPNIVQVYAFGEYEELPYIVQELLPGPTLGRRLREYQAVGQQFSRVEVIAVMEQLAGALDAAHAAGVIHRDVKPENAIYNADGALVLTDFGIARLVVSDVRHTQTGMVVGTPDYISPEQAQGLPATPATDIYSLGVVLYELLAGKMPFQGETPMRVMIGHIQSSPPPLQPLRPDLPSRVDTVVQQTLAKEPTQRFTTAKELVAALRDSWPELPVAVSPPVVPVHEQETQVWEERSPQPAAAPPPPLPESQPSSRGIGAGGPPLTPGAEPDSAAQPPPKRRGFPAIVLAGVVLLAVIAGVGIALLNAFGGDSGGVATAPTETATATPEQTALPSPTPTPNVVATEVDGGIGLDPTVTLELPTPEPPTETPPPPERLLFTSDRNTNFQLFTIGTNSDELTAVYDNGANSMAPDWSPDGSWIAFHSNVDGDEELYIIQDNGTNVRQITNNNHDDREPVWSPDGQQLAYWANPDGSWDLFVIDLVSGTSVRLTNDFADEFQPAWSPDGNWIAFTSNRETTPEVPNDEIYIIRADGSYGLDEWVRLTDMPGNDKYPAWSPDGNSIAFASERDGNSEIYVMAANGSDQRNLTNVPVTQETQPAWSPDGLFLAFTTDRNGNNEIYTMTADGKEQRRITNDPADDFDASWSP